MSCRRDVDPRHVGIGLAAVVIVVGLLAVVFQDRSGSVRRADAADHNAPSTSAAQLSDHPALTASDSLPPRADVAAATPSAPTTSTPQPPPCSTDGTGPSVERYPDDLPLPPDTVAVREESDASGSSHVVVAVAPTDVDSVASFVRREWPQRGWTEERFVREFDHARGSYSRGSEKAQITVRSCEDPARSELVIAWSP
jgi:hypothetical protein